MVDPKSQFSRWKYVRIITNHCINHWILEVSKCIQMDSRAARRSTSCSNVSANKHSVLERFTGWSLISCGWRIVDVCHCVCECWLSLMVDLSWSIMIYRAVRVFARQDKKQIVTASLAPRRHILGAHLEFPKPLDALQTILTQVITSEKKGNERCQRSQVRICNDYDFLACLRLFVWAIRAQGSVDMTWCDHYGGYGHAKLRHFLPHFGVQVQNIDSKPRRGPLITSQISQAQRLGLWFTCLWPVQQYL